MPSFCPNWYGSNLFFTSLRDYPCRVLKKPYHVLTKIGFAVLGIGLLGIVITSLQISSIKQDQDIYGLADAATVTCDQIDFLNDFFNEDVSKEDCENDGGTQARYDSYDKLPLLQNLRIGAGVSASLGLLAIFAPGLLKLPTNKSLKITRRTDSIESRLAKLQEMREKGLISEEEFDSLRRKALEEM
jgi:hypothetical protein